MRIAFRVVMGMVVAGSLFADRFEVLRISFAGQESITAFYQQKDRFRTDVLNSNGTQKRITIEHFHPNTTYTLIPESLEYAEMRFDPPGLLGTLAQWIARPTRIVDSGKSVQVYYDETDTGERKQFFGQTARHLLIRERHVAEAGACQSSFEMQKEG